LICPPGWSDPMGVVTARVLAAVWALLLVGGVSGQCTVGTVSWRNAQSFVWREEAGFPARSSVGGMNARVI
jgi:hypothetical protein